MKKILLLVISLIFTASIISGQVSNTPQPGRLTAGLEIPNGSVVTFIDWGDGNITIVSTHGFYSHTYAKPGIYTIRALDVNENVVFVAIVQFNEPTFSEIFVNFILSCYGNLGRIGGFF
jgi:hypothetical protein